MKKSIQAILLLVGVASVMTGCHKRNDPYLRPWYDVYGFHCGSGNPRPGCNFYSDGTKIIDFEDPHFYSGYYLDFDFWLFTDSYGFSQAYLGYAWLSPTGILYDEFGYALNEAGEEESRDFIGEAAAIEEREVRSAGEKLADRYGLASAEAGIRIARTLNDWATLGKRRTRTEKDIADFSKRLYGVDVARAQAALNDARSGETESLDSVNVEIATHWGTHPETSKEILRNWYRSQLSEFNLD